MLFLIEGRLALPRARRMNASSAHMPGVLGFGSSLASLPRDRFRVLTPDSVFVVPSRLGFLITPKGATEWSTIIKMQKSDSLNFGLFEQLVGMDGRMVVLKGESRRFFFDLIKILDLACDRAGGAHHDLVRRILLTPQSTLSGRCPLDAVLNGESDKVMNIMSRKVSRNH